MFSSFFFNGDPLVGWLAMSNSSDLELGLREHRTCQANFSVFLPYEAKSDLHR